VLQGQNPASKNEQIAIAAISLIVIGRSRAIMELKIDFRGLVLTMVIGLIPSFVGFYLMIVGEVDLGDLQAQGLHVRCAGLLLTLPLLFWLLMAKALGGDSIVMNAVMAITVGVCGLIAYMVVGNIPLWPAERANKLSMVQSGRARVLTVAQAASYLHVQETQIMAWIEQGKLVAAHTREGFLLSRQILDDFAQEHALKRSHK
jgi:excisionase family DNA binding protein